MKIISLNIAKSKDYFENFRSSEQYIPPIDPEYTTIKTELKDLFNETFKNGIPNKEYTIDFKFGIALKEYFDSKEWFNLRVAADIGFWRYLSVVVIPEIVAKRWQNDSGDHFWAKPSRIWLRSIWWFAYLAWQNDKPSTEALLEKDVFSTDTILNIVERTGRKGTHIKTYKTILEKYGSLNKNAIDNFKSKKSDTLFRSVMRLNTALILVMEPDLCEKGVEGYVDKLFTKINANTWN